MRIYTLHTIHERHGITSNVMGVFSSLEKAMQVGAEIINVSDEHYARIEGFRVRFDGDATAPSGFCGAMELRAGVWSGNIYNGRER